MTKATLFEIVDDEHEGMMQCMECKQYFKECICFKSDGFIPKIWYCDRCCGVKEGYAKALDDVEKVINELTKKQQINCPDNKSGCCVFHYKLTLNPNELKQQLAKLEKK